MFVWLLTKKATEMEWCKQRQNLNLTIQSKVFNLIPYKSFVDLVP